MGFLGLLEVASMPVLEVLIVSLLGAFLATQRFNILPADACKHLNKLVFTVFTPCLMFASLAKSVTFKDIISWWFMPVSIGIFFLIGGILGWILVKLIKLERHLEGLVVAMCTGGNLGNLVLIVVSAVCNEDGTPFGETNVCKNVGLSYASFSMAIGSVYIWTVSYNLIHSSAKKFEALQVSILPESKVPNEDLDASNEANLLKGQDLETSTNPSYEDVESKIIVPESPRVISNGHEKVTWWGSLSRTVFQILEELSAPPTIGAFVGFIFGSIPWLKKFIIGDGAPLHVIQDSVKLLGDGTIPCTTLILGANLTEGLRSSKVKPLAIIGIICIRYLIMPVIGIGVVRAANAFGFLPSDPLFHYMLMLQYTLPPAMSMSTMTQLFNVAKEECSVILLWTYLVAAFALTTWSTVFLYVLT